MSDEPTYHFYRYNGENIKYLGAVGSYTADSISFDGKGHVATKDSIYLKQNKQNIRYLRKK